jgi:hypothetical protein
MGDLPGEAGEEGAPTAGAFPGAAAISGAAAPAATGKDFSPQRTRRTQRNFGLKTKTIYGTQMNADFQDFKYKELTDRIIKIFYKVYGKVGYGFLEKVYENAMGIEFRNEGITA